MIDERPEEVTDMARSVKAGSGCLYLRWASRASRKVASIVLEKAKRVWPSAPWCGNSVDSITRLARAYNTVVPSSGKILSVWCGCQRCTSRSVSLVRPVKLKNGAHWPSSQQRWLIPALRWTVIFEEFKGTGNMELQLDRKLSNRRMYPSIDAGIGHVEKIYNERRRTTTLWILRKFMADKKFQ